MKEIKKGLLRMLFVLELVGFSYIYVFGAQGLHAFMGIKKEGAALEKEIEQLHTEVAQLESQVVAWQEDLLGKEKIAREQLQMARKGDEIYYLD